MKKQRIAGTKTVVLDLPEGISFHGYTVMRDSDFTLAVVANKRTKSEATVHIHFAGTGARARIVGIVVGGDQADLSLHTLQHHEAPETTSNLLVKTILDGQAVCRYEGAIRVDQGAQKTDAYQRNENLLLSAGAKAVSSPMLEIAANDVRCTHGATVGPLDEEQLWYLESRGVGKVNGQKLIVNGFINDALGRIDDAKVKKRLQVMLGVTV